MRVRLLIPSTLLVTIYAIPAKADDTQLAIETKKLLRHYCFECHGQNEPSEGGMNYVVDLSKLVSRGKVKAGAPEESRLIKRMRNAENPMPPDYATNGAPTPEEINLIARWIAVGAPDVPLSSDQPQASRPFISTEQVIAAIHSHLERLDPEDRRFQRYLTLHHLHNQPPSAVSNTRLRSVRAAASKLLNSLSWRFEITVPGVLDAEQTILAFDLRDVDWDANREAALTDLWTHLAALYPYGLTHDQYPDVRKSCEMAEEIYEWTGTTIPWVRADWFVATASQPPLYHTLLFDEVFPELAARNRVDVKLANGKTAREPAMNVIDLERWLRVDVAANVRRGRAARAGFASSGVSRHSRIVERHPALYGAYWKSYDFGPNNPTGNVQARPLGPPGLFSDQQLRAFEFRHNGGEMIFNLPNGLQGYLLTDAVGKRINLGPTDIVRDRDETIGTPEIVNGLSCMSCHNKGMKRDFTDDVRLGSLGFSSDARNLVRRLYLDPADMKPLVDRDESRFLTAIEQCTGPYLRGSNYDGPDGEDLDEPIGPVAKTFLTNQLTAAELAFELGLKGPEELRIAIENNPTLQQAGLAAVAAGAALKRDTWEAGQGQSLFQTTARQLKLGKPTSVIAPQR